MVEENEVGNSAEQAQLESAPKKPQNQWWIVAKGVKNEIRDDWLPDITMQVLGVTVLAVFALLIMRSHKTQIIGIGVGLTITIWIVIWMALRHIPPEPTKNSSEQPTPVTTPVTLSEPSATPTAIVNPTPDAAPVPKSTLAHVANEDKSMPAQSDKGPQSSPTPQAAPASISQTMTNSPGGIQAGRDVIINRDKRLIHSLVLHGALETATQPQAVKSPETDLGWQSIVALFTTDGTRIRFATDYKIIEHQVTPTLRRLQFVYSPESPTEILSREVDFLGSVKVLAINYAEICKQYRFGINNEPIKFHLAVLVNGVTVASVSTPFDTSGRYSSGQVEFTVSQIFSQIPQVYNDTVSR